MTREDVGRLSALGLTVTEMAARLGLAKSTVCYHLRRLGIPSDSRYGQRYDWSEVKEYYDDGHTFHECRRRFGFSSSAWADAVRRRAIVPRSRTSELELLVKRGGCPSRGALKTALLREGLKDGACERCGIRQWRERALSLALHHVNGDGADNRLDNLLLLCPNCHSQTENYGGRNSGRKARLARATAATGPGG